MIKLKIPPGRSVADIARKVSGRPATPVRTDNVENLFGDEIMTLIAHQILTPLSVIDGSAQHMQRRAAVMDSAEIERRSARIRKVVDELSFLSRSLLGRIQRGGGPIPTERELYGLKQLFAAISDRVKCCQPDRAIKVTMGKGAEFAFADPLLLHHTLMILADNAAKYSAPDTEIKIESRRAKDGTIISVSDKGIGIPKDQISNLFSPRFRASNAKDHEGSGMGLYLADRIVRTTSGSVTVESTEGVGTTFSVYLPDAVKRCPKLK